MILILNSFWSRLVSSRIWSWTMTSKAVVGSSAMISLGRQAKAMAMIARCFIPPLYWWG